MATETQTVLIASDDVLLVDRLLPLLRRSNLSVRQVNRPAGARQLVRREHADLVVVAMSPEVTAAVLSAARSDGSLNQRSALLAIANGNGNQERLTELANKVLPVDCSRTELQEAVTALLEIAPRAEVRAPIRLRLGVDKPASPTYDVGNISASGMLVVGAQGLEVGSRFGFELALPDGQRPILGQAEVVRLSDPNREGMEGLGASFVTLGGEAPERVRALVEQRLSGTTPAVGSAAAARQRRSRTGSSAAVSSAAVDADHLADRPAPRREELDEVNRHLDGILADGLMRRLKVVTWYVTGAELGLVSLGAFYRILDAVYKDADEASPAVRRRLHDLARVHEALSEFAKPTQYVKTRVEIMLKIRRPLERLLDELSETEQGGATDIDQRVMVSRIAADIVALMRWRRSLEHLRASLETLQRAGFFFARRERRRRVEELYQRFSKYGRTLGFQSVGDLHSRRGRRTAMIAIDRELEHAGLRLKTIHSAIYPGRTHPTPPAVIGEELGGEVLLGVLADVLVEGYEYLVRAYSAYRHALEVTGSDPGLLQRAARLADRVEALEGRGKDF